MADIKPSGKALFLREEELRRGIELMYFAYRDFTGEVTPFSPSRIWDAHTTVQFILSVATRECG